MILALPKEGKQNWAKIPSGEIVTNEIIRGELGEFFEREILAVADGLSDLATARMNVTRELVARQYFPTLNDQNAKRKWLDKILDTNIRLIQNSRNR